MTKPDLRGTMPETWLCVDCGINTAPGHLDRKQMEQALARDWNNQGVQSTYTELTEIYEVTRAVWAAAGMQPMGGCLCIGCLERRIGRRLQADDFPVDPLNMTPGTERLLDRRTPKSAIARRQRERAERLWLNKQRRDHDQTN